VSELGDYQRTTAREVEADIERLRAELRDLRHVYGSTPEEIRLEIDRLTRALAERDAECRAHMEMRHNAEREQKLAADLAWRMEVALRDLWRIADDCGRCTNMDETDRAFALMAERVDIPSASPAELSPAGYFSPAGPPSSRGLTLAEGEAYEQLLAESFGGTYDEEAGP